MTKQIILLGVTLVLGLLAGALFASNRIESTSLVQGILAIDLLTIIFSVYVIATNPSASPNSTQGAVRRVEGATT